MAQQRKAIRKKIIELVKGSTIAEDRVFSNQATPVWQEEVLKGPVILIYPESESIDKFAQAPREYRHNLMINFEIHACGPEQANKEDGTPVEDLLDDVVDKILDILSVDTRLGPITILGKERALVDDLDPVSLNFDFQETGTTVLGSARLGVLVAYHAHFPISLDKQKGIGDHNLSEVEWKIGHDNEPPDDQVEATDTIDLTTP